MKNYSRSGKEIIDTLLADGPQVAVLEEMGSGDKWEKGISAGKRRVSNVQSNDLNLPLLSVPAKGK